ncbi:Argininosuccinate lyase [Variovorax sp. SRS16]|uniref:tripartite tricarboxylate transporter substrate binding protein n=1 Tax=Variovorax sp. SRS16 TaxID=282217 RepID=UPI001317123F|nr:tripartite tricarboxylate transporter substrate binding protein [Variovorax sp. SRS16]VTU33243.1 Argininosuccinate lyase [Variovorax sp. SRS16]
MNRRSLVRASSVLVLSSLVGRAFAEAVWPARPIRIIAPFAPGGGPDILARLLAQQMGPALGSIIVENRAGAAGNIGADYVAKAAPDGYTLLLTTTATQAINPALYAAIPYDPLRDFTPISMVASTPLMLAAAPDFEANNLKELLALAKAKPGKISFASAGIGTMQHMVGVLVEQRAQVEMLHVPYKGSSQIVSDLISGRVSIVFNSTAALGPMVRDGRLKALAVTSPQRLPAWPDVPTVSEAGLPGFEASAWYAVFGPAHLPPAIVQKLNREIVRAVASPACRDTYASLGLDAVTSTPQELGAVTQRDLATWSGIIKEKHIRAE